MPARFSEIQSGVCDAPSLRNASTTSLGLSLHEEALETSRFARRPHWKSSSAIEIPTAEEVGSKGLDSRPLAGVATNHRSSLPIQGLGAC